MSRKHILRTDKVFHIYKHLHGSDTCLSNCSEECFKIIGLASTAYDLKSNKHYTSFGKIPRTLNTQVKYFMISLSF